MRKTDGWTDGVSNDDRQELDDTVICPSVEQYEPIIENTVSGDGGRSPSVRPEPDGTCEVISADSDPSAVSKYGEIETGWHQLRSII